MYYSLPDNFFATLSDNFDEAMKNGSLKFNGGSIEDEYLTVKLPTEPKEDTKQIDVELQYRTVLSLMHRPEKGDFKKNPFEDPEPELTVVEDFGDYNQFRIVYNKFPVVPNHIMILTKKFKPQTTPLSPDELIASFSLLRKLKEDKKNKWFGFYNCGEESGASQPHKHMQFMTLPEGLNPYPELSVGESEAFIPKADREPLQLSHLPMAHFIAKLPNLDELTQDDLMMYFTSLLQRALTVLRENDAQSIGYNVIMTSSYIMVVPRSHGTYKGLGINSCGILGLFLFKNKELLEIVKNDTPAKVWQHVGFPNTSGQGSDEYHY